MNRQEIQQLLDMFLDGMTTVEQEQRLAEYFRSARDIPPEWEPFRRMFCWFDSGMKPPSLPQRGEEVCEKTTSLVPIRTKWKRMYRLALVASAASVAVLLCLWPVAPQSPPKGDEQLRVKAVQPSDDAAPAEVHAVVDNNHQRQKSDAPSRPVKVLKSAEKNAIAEAERIYNEQDHDMVDERYEDARQAVSTQTVRSRGFFTAVDEQGNVRIIRCTNENTNQSNLVEL